MSEILRPCRSAVIRWVTQASLCLLATALICGCRLSCKLPPTDSSLKLFSVEVPADADVDGHLPAEFRLQQGEVVRSQTCSITRDGQFTFTRTIEAEVGYLGAEFDILTAPAAEALEIEPFSGVLVRSVEADGPAGRAGLRPDDVVVRYGEEVVKSFERLQFLIERTPPGTPVEVEFIQKGKKVMTSVVVGNMTQIVRSRTIQRDLSVLDDMDRTGLKLVEIPSDLRNIAGASELSPTGLLIVQVLPGGPAFFSDLRTRDFLLSVGDQFVNTIPEYRAAVGSFRPGSSIKVVGWREEERIETQLGLASDARAESGFDFIGLIDYEGRPHRNRFRLLWGCLYNFYNCHSIHETEETSEHRTETKWGLVLDLLCYHGRPGKKTLRIAWIFPISFGA